MTVMLLEWVFTSVFLILVVLALRAVLGRRMSAGLRYALWAVVLVRLLMPVQLFTSPIAGTWVVTEKHVEHHVTDGLAVSAAPVNAPVDGALGLPVKDMTPGNVPVPPVLPDAPTVPDAPEPPDLDNLPGWTGYLGWAWLAGSAVVALVFLLSNLRFYWKLRRERIPLEAVDCALRVYVVTGLPSPCLFGAVRPAVYVTPEAAADPDMLRHVLAHEHTHYRHGDHIWSLLRCAALAVHWWNPLVWVSAVLSQRDAELACDEGALKRLGDGERAAYGGTLLALVTAKPRPGDLFRCATTMAGDKKSLKERISRIAVAPKCAVWAVVVAVLVTALACQCAFGQAESEDPTPSQDAAASAEPLGQPSQESFDMEELLTHFAVDIEGVPEDAVVLIGSNLRWEYDDFQRYLWPAFSWLDEEELAEFDDWRVERLAGPWNNNVLDTDLEVWRLNYEYHTTEPDKAEHMLVGGMYVTEDGWFCPTYPNSTYAVFLVNDTGKLGFLTFVMVNDCSPDGNSDLFWETVEKDLEDKFLIGPDVWPRTDLNRNGVPEFLRTYMIDGSQGQRVEVEENGEVIWYEEGFYAHAGWTSVFLCTLDGEDYLLRYHPTMYGGACTYYYELFTLENGTETVVQENRVEFDNNFQPWIHESFDPEAIAAFMDEVNGLLANSVQLINTDANLLDTFEKNGRLYDDLWFLDTAEGEFARDPSKSLLENLNAYQKAMEDVWDNPWDDPWGLCLTTSLATPTGVNIAFTQTGGAPTGELFYGSKYWLLREDEDGWVEVPDILNPNENWVWTDEAYIIPMSGQSVQEVNWSWLYGELPPGRYCICKDVMDWRAPGDYDTQTYYAPFFVE